jgi:hypothetical protein
MDRTNRPFEGRGCHSNKMNFEEQAEETWSELNQKTITRNAAQL